MSGNTTGFYIDVHGKGSDFVCFMACFENLQRNNINSKYTPR